MCFGIALKNSPIILYDQVCVRGAHLRHLHAYRRCFHERFQPEAEIALSYGLPAAESMNEHNGLQNFELKTVAVVPSMLYALCRLMQCLVTVKSNDSLV
jgi:hypothetical protein